MIGEEFIMQNILRRQILLVQMCQIRFPMWLMDMLPRFVFWIPRTGRIEEIVAAHDVGKAVNPLSCEGQIEGGVVMSIGFALREKYPIDENCKPISKYGSLGLFRAHEIPKIDAIVIDKPGLKVACGAIGIGEITSIPTAPAIADAYFRRDGVRRYSLPLSETPYERKG